MTDIQPAASSSNALPAPPQAQASAKDSSGHSHFTFHDFINIINPLQHIPVVGTIYRELTGDRLNPISNVLGGALFGGVIGLATSAVDAIVQETTGEDIGEHIMATLGLHHERKTEVSVQELAQGAGTPAQTGTKSQKPTASTARPVPAFLVAEAAADRVVRAKTPVAASTAVAPAAGQPQTQPTAPTTPSDAPVGTLQPSAFWRGLQRGGTGVTHSAPAAHGPISLGTPKSLIDAANALSGKPSADQAGGIVPTAVTPSPEAVSAMSAVMTQRAQGSAQPASTPSAQPTAPQAAANAAGIQPLPSSEIPQMMMQALAKYEAMHKAPQASSVDQIH